MGKKKSRRSRQTEMSGEAKYPMPIQESPKIEYHQPLTSPYELPIIIIAIGRKRYGVPKYYLQKSPQLWSQCSWETSIALPDVDEDVGHTLVHFLYSDSYETTNSALDQDTSRVAREYRRSILVYKAARIYNLPGLEALARKYIEYFGKSMSVFDMLRTTREVFSKLPKDEIWLPIYIKTNLQHLFVADRSIFTSDEFYGVLGEDREFDEAVMRVIVNIFSDRLQLLENTIEGHSQPAAKHEARTNGPVDVVWTSAESTEKLSTKYTDEEPPVEEYSAEECPLEEAPFAPCSADECPLEEAPFAPCSAEECPPEEDPFEVYATEAPPLEEYSAEDFIAEDPPVKAYYAEECVAEEAPEVCPVEEVPHEECLVEDSPSEESPSEDTPAEDTPTEEAPAEDPPAEVYAAEEFPTENHQFKTFT